MNLIALGFIGIIAWAGIVTISGCDLGNYFQELGITTKFVFYCTQ